MTKVKVFVYGRRQQQQQLRGYDNSSPDFRHGELKTGVFVKHECPLQLKSPKLAIFSIKVKVIDLGVI